MLVSWTEYRPSQRFDGIPWTHILIEESADEQITWVQIEDILLDPVDADPSQPISRSFSTENATSSFNWFTDDDSNRIYTDPIQDAPSEILASVDDINANLDGVVASANLNNTAALQISVARIIRANLAQAIGTDIIFGWVDPTTTPEIIREIAAKMIAGMHYMEEVSRSGQIIPVDHYGAIVYQQGMDLMKQIINGEILITGIVSTSNDSYTEEDFFPIDATDRAFTRAMEL